MESMFDYIPALTGKTAVITGATSGIGLAAARLLTLHGCRVIGVGRDKARCERAGESILKTNPDARITFLLADLASQRQVRHLAAEINSLLLPGLDILVNNAGMYSQRKSMTEDGIERTFAVNHLAPFLLTLELLPLMQKSDAGRIITISSDSHYNTSIDSTDIIDPRFYVGIMAYARSKLANVLFTAEFNRRYRGETVHAFAVDPGLVRTGIAYKDQPALSRVIWNIRRSAGVSPEVPARTILYLASEASIQYSSENYWYNQRPKKASRQAGDPELARKLWDTSLHLCGIDSTAQEK